MNVESAKKSDLDDTIQRIQKVYKKRTKITFLSNVLAERQV